MKMAHTVESHLSWLNHDFLARAIRTGGDDSIKVESFSMEPAAASGENYTCEVLRVIVQVRRGNLKETKSLIVKVEPTIEEMSKLLKEMNTFERESKALSEALPEIHRLLDKVIPGHVPPLTAKCLYSLVGNPVSSIVMEDLKEQGFEQARIKAKGLDQKHCILAMQAIARQHAASVVLRKNNPELFKPFFFDFSGVESILNLYKGVFEKGLLNLANEIETWPEYKDKYSAKLRKIADKSVKYIEEYSKQVDTEFNVLIHGDFTVNNIMFRYSDDNGDVEEIRFVDYQMCQYTSPASELLSFLYTSPSLEIIMENDFLIEEYHKTLGKTLAILGHQHLHPSMSQLQKQIQRKHLIAVLWACAGLPYLLFDKGNAPDIGEVMKQTHKSHFSDQYIEYMKVLLPHFEQKGWLEITS